MEASCPGRGSGKRRRGDNRAEASFDFYDDWEVGEDLESEGLLGWGSGDVVGYGTLQPGRQRGMSYAVGDGGVDISGGGYKNNGFWGRLFGGRAVRYRPSAADLQDCPGGRRSEGEVLLEGDDGRKHRRKRSGTHESCETGSSYSSRGDIFPSDGEDDAVPLDDEFAMVLERRTTQSGGDTENSSNKTNRKRGKRPSNSSRTSTRRTFSERSERSARSERLGRSRRGSRSVIDEADVAAMVAVKDEAFAKEGLREDVVDTLSELKLQERALEIEEEEAVERKREEALRAAAERGLTIPPKREREAESLPATTDGNGSRGGVIDGDYVGEQSHLPTPKETNDPEDEQPSTTSDETSQAKKINGSE